LQKDLQDYLKFYEFPPELRDKLKSTNVLERILREIRRIAKRSSLIFSGKTLLGIRGILSPTVALSKIFSVFLCNPLYFQRILGNLLPSPYFLAPLPKKK